MRCLVGLVTDWLIGTSTYYHVLRMLRFAG